MKNKISLEVLIYAAVIFLSVLALLLAFLSGQFMNIKPVYEGF